MSPGIRQELTANGQAEDCLRKQNGKKLLAELTAENTHGEMTRSAAMWRIYATRTAPPDIQTQNLMMGSRKLRLLAVSQKAQALMA
jgi:hypothetical protein